MNRSKVPSVADHLPQVMTFARELVSDYERGVLSDWQMLAARVGAFYTPARMTQIETIIPGWGAMAAEGDGVTLVHVNCVLMALLITPEYQVATPDQQALLEWTALFHDLSKQMRPGVRDHTHAFRSAALTARALPRLGFAVLDGMATALDDWAMLTTEAIVEREEGPSPVQDNARLDAIGAGIERIYGVVTPATTLIKLVLLHMSITNLSQWPQAAPLDEAQIQRYFDRELLRLTEIFYLADSDGWVIFDPPTRDAYRAETRQVFARLREVMG